MAKDFSKDMKMLGGAAVVVISMATIVITGIAVIGGFKDTGLINNTTADLFITGLGIFGTFVGVLVLAIVGKTIIAMFK